MSLGTEEQTLVSASIFITAEPIFVLREVGV